MLQLLVYLVLPGRVSRVYATPLEAPIRVQLMDLAGDVLMLDEVECLEHLAEAALAQQLQGNIPLVQHRMVREPAQPLHS